LIYFSNNKKDKAALVAWSLNMLDFDKAAGASDESDTVCRNAPSPSELQEIPSNNLSSAQCPQRV
jgi:hypothetical protein